MQRKRALVNGSLLEVQPNAIHPSLVNFASAAIAVLNENACRLFNTLLIVLMDI